MLLRYGRPYLGPIEDSFLQVAPVCHLANLSPHGIHLVHQLALGGTTHSGVTGLPCNAVQVECQQQGFAAHAGRSKSCFTACSGVGVEGQETQGDVTAGCQATRPNFVKLTGLTTCSWLSLWRLALPTGHISDGYAAFRLQR